MKQILVVYHIVPGTVCTKQIAYLFGSLGKSSYLCSDNYIKR